MAGADTNRRLSYLSDPGLSIAVSSRPIMPSFHAPLCSSGTNPGSSAPVADFGQRLLGLTAAGHLRPFGFTPRLKTSNPSCFIFSVSVTRRQSCSEIFSPACRGSHRQEERDLRGTVPAAPCFVAQ